ncbi:hypothetical protein K9N68_37110 (plasmid) [Kovacikia minuta CCNUW1]|uniref:hypothetical protein n=1 Tax=Kovacikia minuta TaxID=2931930 RepID=UPI001CCF859C|nr:hypothetical protein [Kovacikia minuta]UBF29832.1 hypothetical protein K9N68_37110 [Kovacikia minuta CCNUW1]
MSLKIFEKLLKLGFSISIYGGKRIYVTASQVNKHGLLEINGVGPDLEQAISSLEKEMKIRESSWKE